MKIMKIWLSWIRTLTFLRIMEILTKSYKDLWNLENDVNLVKSSKDFNILKMMENWLCRITTCEIFYFVKMKS
jgi:hypothetical protein